MSERSIKNSSTPDSSFTPNWSDGYPFTKVKFNGNYLRQDGVSFLYKNVVNL